MEKEVREDILSILRRTIEILREREEKDIFELKELSEHTTHDASIYQDIDSVQIAIVTFALYKLLERGVEISDVYYKRIDEEFHQAYHALTANDFHGYNEHVQNLFFIVKKIDQRASTYIEEVVDKARITKGSKLFEHGLSAKRAAEIMGVSEWELLGYIGRTQVIERYKTGGTSAPERLRFALGLFGVGRKG